MMGFQTVALPRTEWWFPNCLCGISTRQLELLLWRARLASPRSSSQCLVQMAWLKWNRIAVCSLLCNVGGSTYFVIVLFMLLGCIRRLLCNLGRRVRLSGLAFQINSTNCILLITRGQLDNILSFKLLWRVELHLNSWSLKYINVDIVLVLVLIDWEICILIIDTIKHTLKGHYSYDDQNNHWKQITFQEKCQVCRKISNNIPGKWLLKSGVSLIRF